MSEISQVFDQFTCKICFFQYSKTLQAFSICINHHILCQQCYKKISISYKWSSRCPFCKVVIQLARAQKFPQLMAIKQAVRSIKKRNVYNQIQIVAANQKIKQLEGIIRKFRYSSQQQIASNKAKLVFVPQSQLGKQKESAIFNSTKIDLKTQGIIQPKKQSIIIIKPLPEMQGKKKRPSFQYALQLRKKVESIKDAVQKPSIKKLFNIFKRLQAAQNGTKM